MNMQIDNKKIKEEALILAEETLADIELSRLSLSNIALKASRLARLVNEFDLEKIFEYEASGYPMGDNGITGSVVKGTIIRVTLKQAIAGGAQ